MFLGDEAQAAADRLNELGALAVGMLGDGFDAAALKKLASPANMNTFSEYKITTWEQMKDYKLEA